MNVRGLPEAGAVSEADVVREKRGTTTMAEKRERRDGH